MHISSLGDDQYAFDRRRWALVGRRKSCVLRVGSTLEVRIVRVDIPRRQLDLEPVEQEKRPAVSPPKRKPGKERRPDRRRR